MTSFKKKKRKIPLPGYGTGFFRLHFEFARTQKFQTFRSVCGVKKRRDLEKKREMALENKEGEWEQITINNNK